MLLKLTILAPLVVCGVFAGCSDTSATPRYELRWCAYGEVACVLNQKEGSYVRGGFFSTLDGCNNVIKHLTYHGNKVGGTCVELLDYERKKLDSGA